MRNGFANPVDHPNMKFLKRINEPDYKALLAFDSYRNARHWNSPLLYELKAKYKIPRMQFVFPSGATIFIASFDVSHDIYKHYGMEYDDLFVMNPLEPEILAFLNSRTGRRKSIAV